MFQLVHTFVWLDRDVCGLTRRRGRTRGRESARRSRRGVVARRRSRVRARRHHRAPRSDDARAAQEKFIYRPFREYLHT
jgi:hypothetical protein